MQKIRIEHPSDAGQRIDRFLKKYLPNAALGGIYKMLRTGKIKVNGKKKDQTYKLELEDEINFWLTDEEIQVLKNDIWNSASWTISSQKEKSRNIVRGSSDWKMDFTILYEDDSLMVVNKPAGLSVHAGDHKTKESNLIDQVQDYLAGKHDSLTFRPALVHRIDRDTSGCIMIAKEKAVLELLLSDLQNHRIEKIYHAIVVGVPPKMQDTIRAHLLRIENARDEAKVRVDASGQTAVTHYSRVNREPWTVNHSSNEMSDRIAPSFWGWQTSPSFSLLECRIETGRTHQIRVHLAHIGCPILGDKAYGDKKINSYVSRHLGIKRQLLHARKLSFLHPITKKRLTIEAPYPDDFRRFV